MKKNYFDKLVILSMKLSASWKNSSNSKWWTLSIETNRHA